MSDAGRVRPVELDVVDGMLARFESDYPNSTEAGGRTIAIRERLRACVAELRASRKADRALLAQMAATIASGAIATGDFGDGDASTVLKGTLALARAILKQIDGGT